MANIIMNSVTYSGTAASPGTPFKPSDISVKVEKIGTTLVAKSGKRRFASRGTTKRTWEISWKAANETTRAALRTLHALTTTWTFTDQLGASYTVQTETDDYDENYAFTDGNGNIYYGPKLTVREA